MYYPSTATSTSADFLTFVVTILIRLSRPHGINHTSFIVYLPNLRIKVTVAFGNFTVFCQLVRLIRLHIRFLFVRPRVRYCFFSPKCHHLKLQVAIGFVDNYAPSGLSPQMYDIPVIHKSVLVKILIDKNAFQSLLHLEVGFSSIEQRNYNHFFKESGTRGSKSFFVKST